MLLAQIAPGSDPVQWHAVIPNDVSWMILSGSILAGAALFTHGVHSTFARWAAKGWIAGRTPLYGEVAGYVFGPVLGAYAGLLVWHPGLGALCGLIGSWASPWIMEWLGIAVTRVVTKVVEKAKMPGILKKPGVPAPPVPPVPPVKKP